jgi:hypothetical protein
VHRGLPPRRASRRSRSTRGASGETSGRVMNRDGIQCRGGYRQVEHSSQARPPPRWCSRIDSVVEEQRCPRDGPVEPGVR